MDPLGILRKQLLPMELAYFALTPQMLDQTGEIQKDDTSFGIQSDQELTEIIVVNDSSSSPRTELLHPGIKSIIPSTNPGSFD